jgi:hypothetical protein
MNPDDAIYPANLLAIHPVIHPVIREKTNARGEPEPESRLKCVSDAKFEDHGLLPT